MRRSYFKRRISRLDVTKKIEPAMAEPVEVLSAFAPQLALPALRIASRFGSNVTRGPPVVAVRRDRYL
jgi:hypothetical protein